MPPRKKQRKEQPVVSPQPDQDQGQPGELSTKKGQWSATEAFVTMFDEQKDCDVLFQVGSKTVGAHKAFLKARSEVLEQAVNTWTVDHPPIVIHSLEFDVFKAVLRYIYSDEITVTKDNVIQLLYAAHWFKINHLEGQCAKYLSKNLNSANVLAYMAEAVNFKAVALQEECRKVFSRDTHGILNRKEFLTLSQPALSSLVAADEINILEIDLFLWVKRWMVDQCRNQGLPENGESMRQVIGNGLYNIRFPTMTVWDFCNRVTTIEGLLTDTEIAQAFRKISAFKTEDVSCVFSAKYRCKGQFPQHKYNMQTLSMQTGYNSKDKLSEIFGRLQQQQNLSHEDKRFVQLFLQCCTDQMNTSTFPANQGTTATKEAQDECWQFFRRWSSAMESGSADYIMTNFMALRERIASFP